MTKLDHYKLICGLEVHAELKTNSKMFCGCKNDPFGASKPNSYTCPVCLGLPGGLPVANKKAIEWTIKLGLALGCKINLFSKFDRKNYFYPDLPKGYQISQYDLPFCYDGLVATNEGPVRIARIHLEEDTGKLLHKEVAGKKVSLIDFNRSSVPLIEIVTEPDITSPTQAKEYGKKIRQTLRYLEIADADMEQGGMRLEANISLAKTNTNDLPAYKVEVKNINSFRFVENAIKYEMERHAKLLEKGETPAQETRGWNPITGKTFPQRTKETAEDYRYFPDPDLPPIVFNETQIEAIRQSIPELADEKARRWQKEFGLEPRYATMLTANRHKAEWLETVFASAQATETAPNELAKAIINKKIEIKQGEAASKIITRYQKLTATDSVTEEELQAAITKVLQANAEAVARFKNGETKLLSFFMGQVMRELRKKVDAPALRQKLLQAIA